MERDQPRIWNGVAVLCKSLADNALLMVLQGKPDETPTWAVPGGTVEPGETPGQAAVRETMEETGLTVEILRRYTMIKGIKPYGPYKVTYFEGRVRGGPIRAQDPDGLIHRVAWVPAEALPNLVLTHEDQRDVLLSFMTPGPACRRQRGCLSS